MNHTIEGMTLEGVLREALTLGFSNADTQYGTTRPIEEIIDELNPDAPDPDDYVLVGNFIFRVTDAWDRNGEVIALD